MTVVSWPKHESQNLSIGNFKIWETVTDAVVLIKLLNIWIRFHRIALIHDACVYMRNNLSFKIWFSRRKSSSSGWIETLMDFEWMGLQVCLKLRIFRRMNHAAQDWILIGKVQLYIKFYLCQFYWADICMISRSLKTFLFPRGFRAESSSE